jgi:hypothetical protein
MLPLATSKIWQSVRGLPALERDTLRRHVTALVIGGMKPPQRSAQKKRRISSRIKS